VETPSRKMHHLILSCQLEVNRDDPLGGSWHAFSSPMVRFLLEESGGGISQNYSLSVNDCGQCW
jgi:hypothetical protein